MKFCHRIGCLTLGLLYIFSSNVNGQLSQQVYTDSLQNGWENWSPTSASVDFNSSSFVHSGSQSISVNLNPNGSIFLHRTAFNASPYLSLSFWMNGGSTGGQALELRAVNNGIVPLTPILLSPLQPDSWQFINVALSSLGVGSMDGFWLNDVNGTGQPTFYLDDIQFNPVPEPSAISIVSAGVLILVRKMRMRRSA